VRRGVGPLVDLSLERVRQIFDTNTFSALRIAKAVIPSMAQRRSGLIINIGSVAGEMWVGLYILVAFQNLMVLPVPLLGTAYTVPRRLHSTR
jgi:NAD(P)-dependent dehydrogenase (short-subunit alcohol dehydrogenase family)